MLSPEIIRQIKGIHVRTGRLVDTLMAGQYHSAFRGLGMEFEEVREYMPGDEVKSIDWNVTSRMGRPYVKRYREERELVVMVLVDLSESGAFGTRSRLKRETAAEMAAIIAFNAIRNNDRIGAILFTDRVERYIPPKKGPAHVWRVIKEILTCRPESAKTDISDAVRYFGQVMRKRTVAFLISDFHDTGYDGALAVTGRKHDLIGVLVSDPGDGRLPVAGLVELEDLETGRRWVIDASHRRSVTLYADAITRRHQDTLEMFRRSDVDVIEISTEGSLVDPLRRFFRARERARFR